jgi:hypothetical protein
MRTGRYLPGRQSQDCELQLKETGRSITPEDLAGFGLQGALRRILQIIIHHHTKWEKPNMAAHMDLNVNRLGW